MAMKEGFWNKRRCSQSPTSNELPKTSFDTKEEYSSDSEITDDQIFEKSNQSSSRIARFKSLLDSQNVELGYY